ncbi:MAG: T9SS type A sorting domain-containing protein [Paraprevotella sp.]|nr:T9SS type A sorting domain-containing protein [Paraprevotella sp.]
MVKKTLLLILAAFLLHTGNICRAQEDKRGPETELSETSIVVRGSTISIYNANGSTLEVFSLTGSKVSVVKIDSNEKTIDLNLKKGCYILKVAKVVRKISIC